MENVQKYITYSRTFNCVLSNELNYKEQALKEKTSETLLMSFSIWFIFLWIFILINRNIAIIMINKRRSRKQTNKFPNIWHIFSMDDSLLKKSSYNSLKESRAFDLNVFSKRLVNLRIENWIFDKFKKNSWVSVLTAIAFSIQIDDDKWACGHFMDVSQDKCIMDGSLIDKNLMESFECKYSSQGLFWLTL